MRWTKLCVSLAVSLCCALPLAGCGDDDSGSTPTNNGTNNPDNNPNSTTNNPNSTTNNPTNNPDNNTAAPCTADEECAVGEVCDVGAERCRTSCAADSECLVTQRCGAQGFCESRSACTEGAQCGGDEVCNTCVGRCEVEPTSSTGVFCVQDNNCLLGQFCDTCRSVCREIGQPCEPCNEDIECGGATDLCLDFAIGGRFCTSSCAADSDCPVGFACTEVASNEKQCTPRSGDCSSPGECDDATDCAFGQMCSPLKACVTGCTEGSCPNEDVCDFGVCKPPCASTDECPEGAECTEEGLCRVPGGCLTSRDCQDAGTYCDTRDQMCKEGCEQDRDCAGLKICVNNACVNRPCDGNYLCAFGQVCDIPSGECVVPEGPFCDPCDAEAENQCGGEPNMCLRIQDEDGNALGDFCGVGCDPTNLDACPVGYGCETIKDQDDAVVGNVCFRACDRDPV